MDTRSIVVPRRNLYGAHELKQHINKSTLRGFLGTLSLMSLFLVYHLLVEVKDVVSKVEFGVPTSTEIIDVEIPTVKIKQLPPPATKKNIGTGPSEISGDPTPVQDSEINLDEPEFATIDVVHIATPEGGNGLSINTFETNLELGDKGLKVETREEIPSHTKFIPVEKQPGMDMVELQKSVEYPKLAKEANIEGRVIVRALIDKSGMVRKTMIEYTDNSMLNKAAINAIENYKNFTPAIQNNKAVTVWISIPIKFKLR